MSEIKITQSPLRRIPSPSLDGALNLFIGAAESDNSCIICLEAGELIKNNRCTCIYYFHLHCMEQIECPNKCILCKKEIDFSPLTQQINYTIYINNINTITNGITTTNARLADNVNENMDDCCYCLSFLLIFCIAGTITGFITIFL